MLNTGLSRLTVTVTGALEGAGEDSHREAGREAPDEETGHGADKPHEDGRFPPNVIRQPAPRHSSTRLRHGEDGRRDAGPEGNVVLGDAEAEDHLGEVGEDGGEGQRLREPRDG